MHFLKSQKEKGYPPLLEWCPEFDSKILGKNFFWCTFSRVKKKGVPPIFYIVSMVENICRGQSHGQSVLEDQERLYSLVEKFGKNLGKKM